MFRAEVNGTSKVVIDKMKARDRQKHLHEVRYAKSLIDNAPPITLNLKKKNPKKQQMIEDRYTEIERANRILLEKMSHIINNKKVVVVKQWDSNANKMNNSLYAPSIDAKHSLNGEKRKRELYRINYENHKLLQRLQDKKSSYNVASWEYERVEKEKLMRNISTHPQVIGFTRHRSVPKRHLFSIKNSANTTQMNFTKGLKLPSTRGMKSIGDDSAEDNVTNQSNHDEIADPMNIQTNNNYNTDRDDEKQNSLNLTSNKLRKKPKLLSNKREIEKVQAPKIRPFPTAVTSISPHRILLFEKTTKIGKKEYLVEISRDKLHMFIIAFLIEKVKDQSLSQIIIIFKLQLSSNFF